MKKNLALLAILLLLGTNALPQMVQQIESFESATIFPAPGWRQQKYLTNVNGEFVLQSFASATNPAPGAAPSGGNNLMMFNSFVGANNDTSIIITKPFDFSNNAGVNPQFSFYMYRDNGFALNDDHIRVYINTAPNMTGATLLSNTLGTNKLSRYNATAPAATANTWNLYSYNLAAATYTAKRYYFIIMGVCKDGNNIYLDRVVTNTYPSATLANDVSLDLFYQNTAIVGTNSTNSMVVGIRCIIGGNSGSGVVNGALSTAVKMDTLMLNTNGTTNVSDIENAKIYYTGGSIVFDTTFVSPFPVTAGADDYPSRRFGQTIAVPGTNLDFVNGVASCIYLEYDTTYFWLTYDVKATATNGNFIDADLRSTAVGGTNGACPSPGGSSISVIPNPGGFSIAGSRLIDAPYCVGTYTIGTSRTNGSYTNNDYITHVILNGANGTAINTTTGAKNDNTGLPSSLPCIVFNGGPGCDFTAHPPDYELWPSVTGRTVVLTQGTSYSVQVRAGTWPSNNDIAVFIDYNYDGDFFDAGEKLGQVSLPGLGVGNIPFTIPGAGYVGKTRMRVREVTGNNNIDPCSLESFGEIEDFTVTLSPNCPAGIKLWLGNTTDWNDPANWCNGVPTITDNAFIDRAQVFPPSGTPTRTYLYPVIKSSIEANARNFTISSLDTIVIDAPIPSSNSIKVAKDLTNNGKILVTDSYSNTLVFGNGTLANNIYTPFKSQSTDARTQIIYSAAELAASGMLSNDNISGLEFSLSFKGSINAFNGFTVSYALVPFNQHASNVPYSGVLKTVYGPTAFTTVFPGVNSISLDLPIVWDGVSSLLIQYCFDNNTNIGSNDDRIAITQTTGIKSTLILSSTTNAASGCALVPGAGVTDNFFSGLSSLRPNFTFLLDRPYGKAIIKVQEDWINNGTFVAGYSRVVMDSSIAQTISGSQVTTFNELELNKAVNTQTVTMLKRIIIDSSLVLSQGLLLMNGFNINMNNPSISTGSLVSPQGPFSRTNGYLISEKELSSVLWKSIDSLTGYRVIPFGSNVGAPTYIPFSFNHKSGDIGNVTISTYSAPNNLPFPSTVTHLNNTVTPPANNAAATVDRFWLVQKTGSNPVADIVFRFTASERAVGMSAFNQGKAQPFRTTSNTNSWMRLVAPYTTLTYTQSYGTNASPAFDSVRVVNWDWPTVPQSPPPYTDPAGAIGNSHPWIVTLNSSPCGYNSSSTGVLVSVTNVTNETCAGFANGSISISVTGGSAPYAYTWSNGSVTQNQNNLSAGTYTVTVTDSNGATATTSATVNVSNQLPSPLGVVSGPNAICPGATNITYVVPTTAGATGYQWVLPSNMTLVSGQGTNAIVVNFNVSFTTGVLCVTASNVCGSTSPSCLIINSTTAPSTPSTISGTGYGVCGLTRNYSVTNVANVSYVWSVPAGATIVSGQGTNAVSIQFTTSFVSGAISVVATNACGTSNARTKTVYGKPTKPTVINGPTQLCITDTVVFSTVAVFGNNTYTWTMPTGVNILSGQNTTSVTVKVSASAVAGDVCVKAKNSCGTSANLCLTVSIIPNPLAIGTITGNANGVCNSTKNYSVVNQGGVTFSWTVPAGATILSGQGTNAVSVSYSNSFASGNIVVTGTNSCGNSTSASKTITGKPAVPASITGPTSACFNGQNINYTCSNSIGATSYTWTIPAGASLVSGQGTNSIILNFASIAGNVLALKVKASNACGTSTNKTLNITMLSCPRISNDEKSEIVLFPNPVKDELTVSWFTAGDVDMQVTCIDILGQQLLSKNYESSEVASGIKINTSNFSSGVYFIRVIQGDIVRTRRFVVKH